MGIIYNPINKKYKSEYEEVESVSQTKTAVKLTSQNLKFLQSLGFRVKFGKSIPFSRKKK